ncbi:MAG: glycoside hydrolase family 43 protein [Anaerolineae bacterium]|jgi:GH43 family beta-xylosidase|nr:glycoside hydrolase family 43 protein [Anaerolineae bacterium]
MNPVYSAYFADPFVLRHEGAYYAYGTAPASMEGAQFPILYSQDLHQWEQVGWALQPRRGREFWAPEVAYHAGKFYLYYSTSGVEGQDHQLYVAVSDTPTGVFQEMGQALVPDEPFTIDAHPFQDRDGQWYLYYCKDFLTLDDDHRVGTGIVVDRLIDMTRLAGEPSLVVRPYADWQLFRAARSMYGGIYDWHTVEGAAVLHHEGRYYCFYSGGAWELENYGVAYVIADHPMGPYQRPDPADVPILKTIPGLQIGPGHNSFTIAPEGGTAIVYHAWDSAMTARRMCVDRLIWQAGKPRLALPLT